MDQLLVKEIKEKTIIFISERCASPQEITAWLIHLYLSVNALKLKKNSEVARFSDDTQAVHIIKSTTDCKELQKDHHKLGK